MRSFRVKNIKVNYQNLIVFTVEALIFAAVIFVFAFAGKKKLFPRIDEDKTQILFLGDSNFANDFGEGALPNKFGDRYEDIVTYDGSMGGSSAANLNTEHKPDSYSECFCLHSISKMMETDDFSYLTDDPELLKSRTGGEVKFRTLPRIDFGKMDYVILNFGMNDYLQGVPAVGDDEYSYSYAMKKSIERIHKACPNAKIIACSVTFYYYIDSQTEEVVSGNEYSFKNGNLLYEYRDALKDVCEDFDYVVFVDSLEELGIDESNCLELMDDNVHLNSEGQDMYVELIHDALKREKE